MNNRVRPVVGVIGNHYMIDNQYPVQATGEMNLDALSKVCDAVAVAIPSIPDNSTPEELSRICDGFLLTGGRPNIHPKFYGQEETEAHAPFDINRDMVTLPLIKHCINNGKPILGVCRGFEEINVALGGTLHPEIRDLPGRMNHRMPPDGTLEQKFALRHNVCFNKNGPFHRLFGQQEILVNSLHGQGIDCAGSKVVLDGFAPDGTPEALYIQNAKNFCYAFQWHPEWRASIDPNSLAIFKAFGKALRGEEFL
ncbi:MAG: gamma-glutamyl-gamma-aminobutyrate hydrolase family protein [Pseudomonadota bacterium]|nr:gamma-glutamyl-gamma-aminobutyrate hydrolase family protein [Pseudomonadota bacterium]